MTAEEFQAASRDLGTYNGYHFWLYPTVNIPKHVIELNKAQGMCMYDVVFIPGGRKCVTQWVLSAIALIDTDPDLMAMYLKEGAFSRYLGLEKQLLHKKIEDSFKTYDKIMNPILAEFEAMLWVQIQLLNLTE